MNEAKAKECAGLLFTLGDLARDTSRRENNPHAAEDARYSVALLAGSAALRDIGAMLDEWAHLEREIKSIRERLFGTETQRLSALRDLDDLLAAGGLTAWAAAWEGKP